MKYACDERNVKVLLRKPGWINGMNERVTLLCDLERLARLIRN